MAGRITTVVAIAAALALGSGLACAASRAGARVAQAPAAAALPVADPADQWTPRERPRPENIDQVAIAMSRERGTRLALFLEPPLTPAEQLEFRQAIGACVWNPIAGPEEASASLRLLVFGR